MIVLNGNAVQLREFEMADAEEVFACVTPGITRYLPWDPPSWVDYSARCEAIVQKHDPNEYAFVIRRSAGGECLGLMSLEGAAVAAPEIGLWLKGSAHGHGIGKDVSQPRIRALPQRTSSPCKPARVKSRSCRSTASRRIS